MTVTVFTPTYNRVHLLPRLYDSLCHQTDMDFEWLVIDDGSCDGTDKYFGTLQDSPFPIRYEKTDNGGKHRAINAGVKEAAGELFFIVDSDDYLRPHAIRSIKEQYASVRDDVRFAGVCGLKVYDNGEKVGGGSDFGILDCSSLEFRYKYNVKGDMAEVLRTDILKSYPFPEIPGERFCPEALVFNRIARKHIIRYFYDGIYVCEYQSDGLSSRSVQIRKSSPKATRLYYKELMNEQSIPMRIRLRAWINLLRFSIL